MFGLPQGKTNQWLHVLLPVLPTALRQLGDAPSRSLADLAPRIAVPLNELMDPSIPLFVTMGPSDAFNAPKLRMNRKAAIAARKSVTP